MDLFHESRKNKILNHASRKNYRGPSTTRKGLGGSYSRLDIQRTTSISALSYNYIKKGFHKQELIYW